MITKISFAGSMKHPCKFFVAVIIVGDSYILYLPVISTSTSVAQNLHCPLWICNGLLISGMYLEWGANFYDRCCRLCIIFAKSYNFAPHYKFFALVAHLFTKANVYDH
jgi:hypothetical protein